MADLKTNYKDDVLDTSKNEKRKFRMIQNDDGTVSFDDATEYTQQGDAFGAADINATNAKINEQNQSLTNLKNPAKGTKGILVNGGSPLSKDCLLVYTLKTTDKAQTGASFSLNGIKIGDLVTRTPNNVTEISGCIRAFKGDIVSTNVATVGGYAVVYAYIPNTI